MHEPGEWKLQVKKLPEQSLWSALLPLPFLPTPPNRHTWSCRNRSNCTPPSPPTPGRHPPRNTHLVAISPPLPHLVAYELVKLRPAVLVARGAQRPDHREKHQARQHLAQVLALLDAQLRGALGAQVRVEERVHDVEQRRDEVVVHLRGGGAGAGLVEGRTGCCSLARDTTISERGCGCQRSPGGRPPSRPSP